MIVVKVELHSAVTGEVTEIGRTYIANDGTGTRERGNYKVKVCRKNSYNYSGWNSVKAAREGEVKDYPRLTYNMWRLIIRALKGAFPEEK